VSKKSLYWQLASQFSYKYYHDFCDQIETTVELAKNKTEHFQKAQQGSYRYISSDAKHQLRDAPTIYRPLMLDCPKSEKK